jgi:hypothetical protein
LFACGVRRVLTSLGAAQASKEVFSSVVSAEKEATIGQSHARTFKATAASFLTLFSPTAVVALHSS